MSKVVFYNNTPITLDKLGFSTLKKAFKNIKAGGGLVKNSKNEYLLIFRHGKWDLPKGKPDVGEIIESCALREVEEETGISNLTIVRKLPKTYHLYTNSNGEIILKKCHWFEMKTTDEQPPKPQVEEGITDIGWFSKEDVEALKPQMFSTIRQCFEYYFSLTQSNFWNRLFGRC